MRSPPGPPPDAPPPHAWRPWTASAALSLRAVWFGILPSAPGHELGIVLASTRSQVAVCVCLKKDLLNMTFPPSTHYQPTTPNEKEERGELGARPPQCCINKQKKVCFHLLIMQLLMETQTEPQPAPLDPPAPPPSLILNQTQPLITSLFAVRPSQQPTDPAVRKHPTKRTAQSKPKPKPQAH